MANYKSKMGVRVVLHSDQVARFWKP